jgi:RNA polymerase sigma factor (sigma-70 family)
MTTLPALTADQDRDITAVVLRERSRLGQFIRRRVPDRADAEDILQEVFYEFVDAYRLPASIEQASAWLFRVARNRIIDRFRRKKEVSLQQLLDAEGECRLDLALPSGAGPEAEYARSVLLLALQQALAELPPEQREVFVAHELEGRSFKDLAAQAGVAVNTLLARKRYAVLYLRARLQSTYDELDV